jgi:hypothetical protein
MTKKQIKISKNTFFISKKQIPFQNRSFEIQIRNILIHYDISLTSLYLVYKRTKINLNS